MSVYVVVFFSLGGMQVFVYVRRQFFYLFVQIMWQPAQTMGNAALSFMHGTAEAQLSSYVPYDAVIQYSSDYKYDTIRFIWTSRCVACACACAIRLWYRQLLKLTVIEIWNSYVAYISFRLSISLSSGMLSFFPFPLSHPFNLSVYYLFLFIFVAFVGAFVYVVSCAMLRLTHGLSLLQHTNSRKAQNCIWFTKYTTHVHQTYTLSPQQK